MEEGMLALLVFIALCIWAPRVMGAIVGWTALALACVAVFAFVSSGEIGGGDILAGEAAWTETPEWRE